MTSTAGPPVIFDPARRRARLRRAAALGPPGGLPGADFLHARAAEGAVDSLEAILRDFPVAVDLSARPDAFAARLAGSDAAGRVSLTQASAPEWAASPGGVPMPVADGSADLIVSLMTLHWANDLPGALSQIRRALRPDGLFLGGLMGAATLKELRAVLTEAELAERGGAQARVSPFADGFDGAALLQRAGFALPVSDVDRFTVRYPDLFALIRDLRAMGETQVLAGPVRPLTRGVLMRAAALYAERFGETGPDGSLRLPATFEIVNLAGWAPHESQPRPLPRGSARLRLADALGVREHRGES